MLGLNSPTLAAKPLCILTGLVGFGRLSVTAPKHQAWLLNDLHERQHGRKMVLLKPVKPYVEVAHAAQRM